MHSTCITSTLRSIWLFQPHPPIYILTLRPVLNLKPRLIRRQREGSSARGSQAVFPRRPSVEALGPPPRMESKLLVVVTHTGLAYVRAMCFRLLHGESLAATAFQMLTHHLVTDKWLHHRKYPTNVFAGGSLSLFTAFSNPKRLSACSIPELTFLYSAWRSPAAAAAAAVYAVKW
jgi:hypothetical protein